MDHTEDLSARVLLKHILNIEPPRTPLTRSASRAQSTSGTSGPRRSNRLSIKDAVAQTPQDILRRSLKHKIQESISRKSLPATRRRTTSVVLKKANTPGPASLLFDDGDTPRHILKNILLTEPVKSPVVHEGAGSDVPQLPSANSSLQSKRPSMELSGLELPDVTMGNVVSTVKGLSRKRPRRSLNVTAFENRLKDGNDVEESLDDQSSLSLSSSTSLSLKTPFMDIRTERKGLQRRVSNRRKISEEEFGAAVNKRQMGNDHGFTSFAPAEQGLSDSVHSEGFTLGLSKLSLPDITTDIINCNTALYAQTDAETSNVSNLATQDKPPVMALQLQREMEQNQLEREKSVYAFPTEEGILNDSPKECVSTMSGPKKEVMAEKCQPGDAECVSTSEEDEGMKKSQASENDDPAESKQEENAAEPQAKEDDSQTEEGAAAGSQSEEEDIVEDTQTEEGAVESQSEEDDDDANSQSEKEEDAESDQEVPVTSSQSEEVDSVTDFQSKNDGDVRQEGDEDQGSKQLAGSLEYIRGRPHRSEGGLGCNWEYINRRAHRSEGGLIIRVRGTERVLPDTTETGIPDDNSKAHDANHLHGNTDIRSGEISYGMSYLAKSSTRNNDFCAKADPDDDENTFHLSLTTECDLTKNTDAQDPEEEGEEEMVDEDGEEQVVEEIEEEVVDGEEEEMDGKEGEDEMVEEEGGEEMVDEDGEEEMVDGEEKVVEEIEEEVVDGKEEVVDGEEDEEMGEEEMVDGQEEGEEEMVDLEEVVDEEEEGEEEMVDPEEVVDEEEEDEDEENEDIPMKTPAFVKEKRNFICPDPLASPVLKNIQSNQISEGLTGAGAKPKPGARRKTRPAKKESGLPKSYLMTVFKHFAKTKVSADVYPVLQEIMDKFFDRLAKDLEAYALHARRKTIEVEDAELLLKRQGYVNDKVPVEVLIEKYLRMEQRKLLIPIATSGNVVIPKRRR